MPSHKIKNAVFDIRFGSRTVLLQENYSLGGFVKQGLMPVVDTVLSRHDRDGSVICIDQLVIDLGRLHYSDFKSQMARRLGAELDAILRSKIQHLKKSSNSRERIIPSTRRDLELIEHFLMTGTLPGSLSPKHYWIPDRQLQLILKQEQSDFLRFLQKTAHRPQVIQRLVRQFSAGTVRQVVRLLAPTQSETALQAVDVILRRYPGRSPTGMQTAAFTTLVWELLLTYLLQNPDSRFTAAKFSNWIIGKLEQRQGAIPEALTAILAEEIGKQVLPEDLTPRPARPSKTGVPGKESRKIFKGYDLSEALRFYLQHGMLPWAAGTLSPNVGMAEIIEELKESHPEKLLKLATDLQYDSDLCRRLVGHLTPPVMTQFITALLTVISSGNHKDRLTFIQSINEFADRAADRQGYLTDLLRNLVTRQPIDLKQLAARTGDPAKAEPRDVVFDPGQDPDLMRAYLTTLIKTANKTEAHVSSFSRLLDDLEAKYPLEYREYLAWLAANKKRFASFLRLTGSQKLKKTLARLAGFPSAARTIELLEKVFAPNVPQKSSNREAILRTLTRLIITNTFSEAGEFVQSAVPRLAGLGKAPGSDRRAIEALETLPAEIVADKKMFRRHKDSLAAYQQQGDLEPAAQKTPDKSHSTDRSTTEDETALIRYLTGDPTSHSISDATARVIFSRMIRQGSDALYASLRNHIKDKDIRKKIINLLPENWLTRVLAGLRPDVHLPVQTYADIIADACYSTELFDRPEKINTLKWEFIFTYLASYANRPFREKVFIQRFVVFLAANSPKMDKGTFTALLSRNLTASIKASTHQEKLTVLQVLGHLDDAAGDVKIEPPAIIREIEEDRIEEVVVQNAGMVIAAPYLPKLWDMLELLEGGQFKDLQAAERAVHLLQFMTDECTDAPEYQLVLNKILCGVKSSEPIAGRIVITDKERETVEGLIQGMIENWKTIGQTSVAGFRESFFQRRGRLTVKDDAWHLKVEQRAFDMLLDSIPWGFATIKQPWMERVLYVKWR